jgi:hypothetical protein
MCGLLGGGGCGVVVGRGMGSGGCLITCCLLYVYLGTTSTSTADLRARSCKLLKCNALSNKPMYKRP